MIDIASLRQSWDLLRTSVPEESELRVRGIGLQVPRGEVQLGIDISGDRHLLIPVPPASKICVDEGSSGVRVRPLKLEEGAAKRTFVDVSCNKAHLFDHFDVIIAEVLHELGVSEDRPDLIAIKVLERWRELLARELGSIPSVSRLIGLYGELLTLRHLVEHHPDAVAWWLGPENARHDFVTPFGAVEVKTTRANDDWSVTIHGLGQLALPANGDLFVAVFKIEPQPEGASIADVVDEIVNAGGARSHLVSKLTSWGVEERDLQLLNPHTFELRETRMYEVATGFPRVVDESFVSGRLPSGVRTLQYTIDLSSDPPSPLSEYEMKETFRMLAGAER